MGPTWGTLAERAVASTPGVRWLLMDTREALVPVAIHLALADPDGAFAFVEADGPLPEADYLFVDAANTGALDAVDVCVVATPAGERLLEQVGDLGSASVLRARRGGGPHGATTAHASVTT